MVSAGYFLYANSHNSDKKDFDLLSPEQKANVGNLETDPHYWAPNDPDQETRSYREIYRKHKVFPPKLSEVEKHIVDIAGSYDEDGNKYDVSWTIGGHPISVKISPDGKYYYTDRNNTGTYIRHTGCFGIEVLESKSK